MKKLVPSLVRVVKKIWTTTRIYVRFLFTVGLFYMCSLWVIPLDALFVCWFVS
jgi:hypothetical protein